MPSPNTPENREKARKRTRRYYQANLEHCRKYGNNTAKKLRKEFLKILGDKCKYCGFNDMRIMQVDHIRGDGSADRKKFASGYKLYQFYTQNPILAKERLQLLCPNCNWLKRVRNGETAHK